MVIGSGVWDDVKSLIAAGVLLSHAFSGELKAVSIVNEAVQDCVAEGGVADDVMPMFDGNSRLVTIVEARPWRSSRISRRSRRSEALRTDRPQSSRMRS